MSETLAAPLHHAMIVNAGSSGTRVTLYAYERGKEPRIESLFSQSSDKAIATFPQNPALAGLVVLSLVQSACGKVPKGQTVELNVLGTAGMRLLPKQEQTAIYQAIRTALQQARPQPCLIDVRTVKTISGLQEGVFGWLTVNYLQDNLDKGTYSGVVDIGGTSVQMTFPTSSSRQPHSITLRINGKNLHLFSQSFLGLGQDAVYRMVLQHPQPAVCFPKGYRQGTWEGEFNYGSCEAMVSTILKTFPLASIPDHANVPFVVMGAAGYPSNWLFSSDPTNQRTTKHHITAQCDRGLKSIMQTYPGIYSPAQSCLNGVYLNRLIHQGLQLPATHLTFTDKIKDQSISFVLGALLFQMYTHEELPKGVNQVQQDYRVS